MNAVLQTGAEADLKVSTSGQRQIQAKLILEMLYRSRIYHDSGGNMEGDGSASSKRPVFDFRRILALQICGCCRRVSRFQYYALTVHR